MEPALFFRSNGAWVGLLAELEEDSSELGVALGLTADIWVWQAWLTT